MNRGVALVVGLIVIEVTLAIGLVTVLGRLEEMQRDVSALCDWVAHQPRQYDNGFGLQPSEGFGIAVCPP